jgi:hypothetical protein
MSRVRILVEGQTEEAFINDILNPHLNQMGVYPYAFLFRHKGGSFAYQKAKREILNSLKEDTSLICTTMMDFYGLPKDWPGRTDADNHRAYLDKAVAVERALSSDICTQLGSSFSPCRFISYVQMHEFEALLFSDTVTWTENKISTQLEEIKRSFPCPEEINDNYETCPSRRIINIFKECGQKYGKVIDGINASKKIGLAKMRAACPHFNEWITKLEKLGNQ